MSFLKPSFILWLGTSTTIAVIANGTLCSGSEALEACLLPPSGVAVELGTLGILLLGGILALLQLRQNQRAG